MSNELYEMIGYEIYTILKDEKLEELAFSVKRNIINAVIEDLEQLYNCDPSTKKLEDAIFYHLGFKSIFYYRISHYLFSRENDFFKIKSKKISECAKLITGVEIHPAAKIEGGLS